MYYISYAVFRVNLYIKFLFHRFMNELTEMIVRLSVKFVIKNFIVKSPCKNTNGDNMESYISNPAELQPPQDPEKKIQPLGTEFDKKAEADLLNKSYILELNTKK